MHVDFDQKLLFLLLCFRYCRLPFYRLKIDDEKVMSNNRNFSNWLIQKTIMGQYYLARTLQGQY